jgi:hypothetical protein
VVVTKLNDKAPRDAGGSHASSSATALTASEGRKGVNKLPMSFDQLIARKIGSGAKLLSLELGTRSDGFAESGFSPEFMKTLVWRDSVPLPKIIAPDVAFDRLFQGTDPSANVTEAENRKRLGLSVLDTVKAQRARLRSTVGNADNLVLDEWETSLRELERQINLPAPQACQRGTRPVNSGDLATKTKLMLDISVLAMRCDVTRVASFVFENSTSEFSMPQLGINGWHIGVTHNNPNQPYINFNKWSCEQFAYLVSEFKKYDLLKDSLLYMTSEMANGGHDGTNEFSDYPVLIAGQASGRLQTGRLLERPGESMGSLLYSFMQAFDAAPTTFGSGYRSGVTGLIGT